MTNTLAIVAAAASLVRLGVAQICSPESNTFTAKVNFSEVREQTTPYTVVSHRFVSDSPLSQLLCSNHLFLL